MLTFTVIAEESVWVTFGWAGSCGVSPGVDSVCLGPVAHCCNRAVVVVLVALGHVALMEKLKVFTLMVVEETLLYKGVSFFWCFHILAKVHISYLLSQFTSSMPPSRI
jgi:hypothetical protein